MKINKEVLGKISSAAVAAGQAINEDSIGLDFGKFKKKGGDDDDDKKDKKDKPGHERDKGKDQEKGMTKEEREKLDRDEKLGYCSQEEKELYAKRYQDGDKNIVFDKE